MKSRKNDSSRATLIALGVSVLMLWSVLSAVAQQPRAAAASKHCVAKLEPVKPGARSSKLTSFDCYSSFSEAIWEATDGAVWLGEDTDLRSQLNRLEVELKTKTLGTKADFVLATDHEHSSFGGATLTWTGTSACSSGVFFWANSMPSGWNDVVSSTRGFSNCNRNRLFEHANRSTSGAIQTCTPTCSGLGAMNDKTSSREWRF